MDILLDAARATVESEDYIQQVASESEDSTDEATGCDKIERKSNLRRYQEIIARKEATVANEAKPQTQGEAQPYEATTIAGETVWKDSGLGTSVPTFSKPRSSYMPSRRSSSAQKNPDWIPKLTAEAVAGHAFECFGCGQMVVIKKDVDWNTHLEEISVAALPRGAFDDSDSDDESSKDGTSRRLSFSNETAKEAANDLLEFWGYMFRPDKAPTRLFNALNRAMATYIIHNIGAPDVPWLTPQKLASFYRAVGGNYDCKT
ncbi:hypothetical protein FPRO03_06979 [Fusarium proliferatum]|nr:hypothetical protein FPRO03_06979 [Fusarium proliferatum]